MQAQKLSDFTTEQIEWIADYIVYKTPETLDSCMIADTHCNNPRHLIN